MRDLIAKLSAYGLVPTALSWRCREGHDFAYLNTHERVNRHGVGFIEIESRCRRCRLMCHTFHG